MANKKAAMIENLYLCESKNKTGKYGPSNKYLFSSLISWLFVCVRVTKFKGSTQVMKNFEIFLELNSSKKHKPYCNCFLMQFELCIPKLFLNIFSHFVRTMKIRNNLFWMNLTSVRKYSFICRPAIPRKLCIPFCHKSKESQGIRLTMFLSRK